MAITAPIQNQLENTLRSARMTVIGHAILHNDAEARLLLAAVRAYGDQPDSFAYVSPTRANTTIHPPDLLLVHPDIGLLTIEAKGHLIDEIIAIQAGNLTLPYSNGAQVNVFYQASQQAYDISSDIGRLLNNLWDQPLTNFLVALPNIKESDWIERDYHLCLPSAQILFSEDIADPIRLKSKVGALVADTSGKSGKSPALTDGQLIALDRILGNSATINPTPGFRAWVHQAGLGAYLDDMSNQRNYMSDEQKDLTRLQIGDAPRLIRGVAGSGKTVVLAELAMRYLRRHAALYDSFDPDAEVSVGVLCFNRALVPFLKAKLAAALESQTGSADLPHELLLLHNLNQFMYEQCQKPSRLTYISVDVIRDPTQRALNYRAQISKWQEDDPKAFDQLCLDALFIDESQDLEPEEFRLLLDFVRPHPKTGEKPVVICYDDAQNLYGRTRPNWDDIGLNLVGGRSRVMRQCFRNSRQIVELAFNVLLGTYAPDDLRVQTRTYADVAYLQENNLVEEIDGHYRIHFAQRDEDPPYVKQFPSHAAEADWVADEVSDLIVIEQVRPEDILIVTAHPNQAHFDDLETRIKRRVAHKAQGNVPPIQVEFLHAYNLSKWNGSEMPYIFAPNQLTLASVYSAKGYDAPVVFLTNVHDFDYSRAGRAAFYVGATRAKHRLYVTGMQTASRNLLQEAEKAIPFLE